MESIAVLLALVYVLLALKEQRICFIAGGISATLYSMIFWQVQLYMEAALQVFYVAMSVYGWRHWGSRRHHNERPITAKPLAFHLRLGTALVGLTLLIGGVLNRYTDAASPFLDSFTTLAAMLTTWMVAEKLLENWWYWVLINGLSVYLYLDRGLQLTAVLFAGYVLLSIAGYVSWRQRWQTTGAKIVD
jgi:nicotinamide mononucleotide transporter